MAVNKKHQVKLSPTGGMAGAALTHMRDVAYNKMAAFARDIMQRADQHTDEEKRIRLAEEKRLRKAASRRVRGSP